VEPLTLRDVRALIASLERLPGRVTVRRLVRQASLLIDQFPFCVTSLIGDRALAARVFVPARVRDDQLFELTPI
jgi:hypothetical protein